MAWLKSVLLLFQFLKELWDRFKPTQAQAEQKQKEEAVSESTEAKENPDARPKWD